MVPVDRLGTPLVRDLYHGSDAYVCASHTCPPPEGQARTTALSLRAPEQGTMVLRARGLGGESVSDAKPAEALEGVTLANGWIATERLTRSDDVGGIARDQGLSLQAAVP